MSLTWRSPSVLPPDLDPRSVTPPASPAARLALGGAWRLRAFAHSLAHGLRRVPGGDSQRAVVARIERALAGSDALLEHPALGGDHASELLVQARLVLEPLPFAMSWAEVAMADTLYGRALDAQLAALAGSADAAIAQAARLAAPAPPFGAPVIAALARDAPNVACLSILVDRWLAHACHVFGRPGSAGDEALASAGVRPRALAALGAFLVEVENDLWGWGLEATDAQFMGIIAPEGWSPRRRTRRPHAK